MRYLTFIVAGAFAFFVSAFPAGLSAGDAPASEINFEGIAAGTVISSVSAEQGMSGDVIPGAISIYGTNPGFLDLNAAMVFHALVLCCDL